MNTREIVSYLGGVLAFIIVAMVLRRWTSQEVALGLGWLAMLLIGYPFTRYVSGNRLTFARWAVFTTLGAAAGVTVLRYL